MLFKEVTWVMIQFHDLNFQAKQLRSYLANRPSGGRSFTAFDLVVVSPITRALETAEHIFGSLGRLNIESSTRKKYKL